METALQFVLLGFLRVLGYPFDPKQRIYWLYLLTSLFAALAVYAVLTRRRGQPLGLEAAVRFLAPRSVWDHPGAWLDVRYSIVHHSLTFPLLGVVAAACYQLTFSATTQLLVARFGDPDPVPFNLGLGTLFVYSLVAWIVVDFASFLVHLAQHKIPLLWEFHKVHHSARVLHPLTNYREHPVDNLLYVVVGGICAAGTAAPMAYFVGQGPQVLTIHGAVGFVFLFNITAYNLRHSHVWLRWPGPLVYLWGSPAHHQVHHSCKPEHIDRNLAFAFPIWDVLFGTFVMPDGPEELEFGLGDGTDDAYHSILSLYLLPFAKVLGRLTGGGPPTR